MSSDGVRAMWMRGGSSKGGYFLAADLPGDRDAFLLGVMGSPDPRQIDGLGGADPLTSKVAIVRASDRPGIDVEYLFLQVFVDRPVVTDAQPCGNILAGVGPFAIERGLVEVTGDETRVTILMENTGRVVVATVRTSDGRVDYAGDASVDGVPGTASPVGLTFRDLAGSTCGALLPTGNLRDTFAGVEVTCLDNGMPIIALRAADLGLTGCESRADLDADDVLKARLEAVRLAAGPAMNLGDVADKTVPKMTLLSPPTAGGLVSTRSFIPHRAHAGIGVFAAVSAATVCLIPGTVADGIAASPDDGPLLVEHPGGATRVIVERDGPDNNGPDITGLKITGAGMILSARKLFDGKVFAP